MQFYVYLWLRVNGIPYYVGKGSVDRAFVNDGHGVHRPPDPNRIVILDCPSEEIAFAYEKLLISCYGRKDLKTGCLRNMTDGGDTGPSLPGKLNPFYGKTHTPETREILRIANTGKKQSKETKKKKGDKLRGRVQSPEEIARRTAVLLIVMKDPNIRKRISEANKGNEGGHVRWHVNRGIIKPSCLFCIPQLPASL